MLYLIYRSAQTILAFDNSRVVRRVISALILLLPVSSFAGEPTSIQLVGHVTDLTTISQQIPITSATASTSGASGGASAAVDGSLSSRWESLHGIDPSWLTVDLGSTYTLSEVIIHWEVANAASYLIEGSNDNSSWTNLSSESGGVMGNRTDSVSITGSYRYLRMYGLTRTTVYGYSIFEIEAYGSIPLIVDSDNDGVDDVIDSCPGTAADLAVESDGCEFGAINGYDAPTSYPGYSLAWSDEFNGTALNTADWTHEIGTGCPNLCGWGNNELQYYRAENTTVANGWLTIEAINESFGGSNYTSSRLKTQGKQFFKYGRIDIRAVLPQGTGPWPALWMLGESITSVGWPRSGEIDIMEKIGGNDSTTLGTAHWWLDSPGSWTFEGGDTTLASGVFADEFHVFSIVWNANSISWYLDGATSPFYTKAINATEQNLEFRENFFLLLNVAVGGTLGGTPNNAIFPQKMIIDYVRVYQ